MSGTFYYICSLSFKCKLKMRFPCFQCSEWTFDPPIYLMSLTSVLVSTSTLCSHVLHAWPHSGTLVAVMYSFPSAICHSGLPGGPVSEVPGGVVGMVQSPPGSSFLELFSSILRVSGTWMMCCCVLMDSSAMLVPSCYENYDFA